MPRVSVPLCPAGRNPATAFVASLVLCPSLVPSSFTWRWVCRGRQEMREEPSLLPPSWEMLCQTQPQFPQLGERNIALSKEMPSVEGRLCLGAGGEGNRRWVFFPTSGLLWLC